MNIQNVIRELLGLRGIADCSRRRVGCLITKDGLIVGRGWNALPEGSCLDGACPRGLLTYDQQPKDVGYTESGCTAVHAEVRALAEAGSWADGSSVWVTEPPCPGCEFVLSEAGVLEVTVVNLDRPLPVFSSFPVPV